MLLILKQFFQEVWLIALISFMVYFEDLWMAELLRLKYVANQGLSKIQLS